MKPQTNNTKIFTPTWQRMLIFCAAMFRSWNPDRELQWLVIYNQGVNRFILVRGIGIYGSIVCLPLTYLTLTMAKNNDLNVPEGAAVLTTVLCSLIGGILFGITAWYGTVFSYQRYLEQKKAPQSGAN